MLTIVDGATKIGVSTGDIENAVNRTCKSQVQLIRDIDENGQRVDKTNKWARFKPIPRPNVSYADQLKTVSGVKVWKTVSELSAETKVPWWIGSDGQCGLSFSVYNNLGTNAMSTSGRFFHDLLSQAGLPWTYTPPAGSSSEPLRAYDFHEYFAGAAKPVEGVADTYQLTQDGTLSIQLVTSRGYNDGNNEVALSLSDFTIQNIAGSDFYVGILVWRSNSIFTFKTASAKVGAGDVTVTFSGMASNYGGQTVKIVPFLSSVPISQGVDPGAGVFVSLDVLSKSVEIRGYTQPYTVEIDTIWENSMYVTVLYKVRLHNNTASAVSNDTIYLKVYRSDQSESVGGTTKTGVSVPANGFADIQPSSRPDGYGTIRVNDVHSESATYTLVVSSDSEKWSGTEEINLSRT